MIRTKWLAVADSGVSATYYNNSALIIYKEVEKND